MGSAEDGCLVSILRQQNVDGTSTQRTLFNPNFPAQIIHHFFTDGQTNPVAIMSAAIMQALKNGEHLLAISGLNARPIVVHFQQMLLVV